VNTLDHDDPLVVLERLIVDSTCDWCGKIYLAEWNTERTAYAPVVTRDWRVWVQKKQGYTVKTYAYWQTCPFCRIDDVFGFKLFSLSANLLRQRHVACAALADAARGGQAQQEWCVYTKECLEKTVADFQAKVDKRIMMIHESARSRGPFQV
jgi:hypothetical protein